MSLANLVSILALIAQTNQPMITESPLPNGRQYDIYRENTIKEILLSLNADSAKDNCYLRVSDWGMAIGFDSKQDGELNYLIIYDAKSDSFFFYNFKKKKDVDIIKKGDERYNEVLKIITERKKR